LNLNVLFSSNNNTSFAASSCPCAAQPLFQPPFQVRPSSTYSTSSTFSTSTTAFSVTSVTSANRFVSLPFTLHQSTPHFRFLATSTSTTSTINTQKQRNGRHTNDNNKNNNNKNNNNNNNKNKQQQQPLINEHLIRMLLKKTR
jgi:hypothetical protein